MKKISLFFLTHLLLLALIPVVAFSQSQTISSDKDWASQQAALTNTSEADYIIRLGDVDNLGFGWPEGFDPFCGRMTDAHHYPWDVNPDDLPGFDRITLSSKLHHGMEQPCGSDGYSGSFDPEITKPVTWSFPTTVLKGAQIRNAYLQLFIDDFQAPSFCSKFHLFINGSRFAEGERLLNAIDQTGPVGKLLSIPLPEEYFEPLLTKDSFTFLIDEGTGAADGWAVDFIRLLVNRKRENTCKGEIIGRVLEKDTDIPIPAARVSLSDHQGTTSNAEGVFTLKGIPTGYEIVTASAPGYTDAYGAADVGEGENNDEVIIYLSRGRNVQFGGKTISVGESINLNNILFDQGKSELRQASKEELDKIAVFLETNPNAEIELSGHTSSEGEAGYNRSLSYKRVKACKDYILLKGIDPGRIIAVGFGPDHPVVPNDSETNRAKNRRVEMRVVKL